MKTLIIGLDAAVAQRVYRLATSGSLPHLGRLMERGVHAPHCLVPFPTITPPNWTTIATGAWPGTHGITDYFLHRTGDPLDQLTEAFSSTHTRAETLWEAAERAGRRSIVVDYPVSWPPKAASMILLGGAGVGINDWRDEDPGVELADDQIFATEDLPLGTPITLAPAADWQGDVGPGALAAELSLSYRHARTGIAPRTWHLLVQGERALLCAARDTRTAFAVLAAGEWSPVITQMFETTRGEERAAFRCKLLELSAERRVASLYVTALNALEGWSYPAEVAAEIRSDEGLPCPRGGYHAFELGWIDLPTLVEAVEIQHTWTADAVTHLQQHKPWDLVALHIHCPDWTYHTFSRQLEPAYTPDAGERAAYERAEEALYQSIDRLIGRLVAAGGSEDTLVVVTSDHGAKAHGRDFHPGSLLAAAGLTAYTEDESGAIDLVTMEPGRVVDWTRTKAIVQRSCYVYVNLQGRDPAGIVPLGAEYEAVRDAVVIDALLGYTDPATGRKPVTLAVRKEDARLLGLYGEGIGDVVFALDPAYGHEHGSFLPTAVQGFGGMQGLLIMAGPGVKRGVAIERTVHLVDIVPTICYLTGLPIPHQAEGAVLYQALERPDGPVDDLRALQQKYQRLERVIKSTRAETHVYHQPPPSGRGGRGCPTPVGQPLLSPHRRRGH